MVWAGISTKAHTDLIFVENRALNAHRYVEDVPQEAVIPFIIKRLSTIKKSFYLFENCIPKLYPFYLGLR